jgi:hypothetical protein
LTDAATIARSLGGKRNGDGWLVPCPVSGHGQGRGDRNPSLSIHDGDRTLLVRCFAGCDPRDVLDVLRRRGLLSDDCPRVAPCNSRQELPPPPHDPDPAALAIWVAASAAAGSTAETYLYSRNITLPVPPSLRCGSVMHRDRYLTPAMVAAVQRPDGKIVSVQTTLLTLAGRKAPVAIPRITTGALGVGAVRFGKATDVLGLAEGIETALSAMQLTDVPTWACLGAGRMHRIAIPDHVRELHLFGDNDGPGRDAVERTAYANRHRRVVLRFPPDSCNDWNDFATSRCEAVA